MAARCDKTPCPKLRVLGSRCVRHWLHRQWAYRKLPTVTLWWRAFEPALVGGIEARVSMGEAAPPPCIVMPPGRDKWAGLVLNLIAAADAAWRKHAASLGDSEEAR